MIGCTLPSNDIYVFFEDGEIEQLSLGQLEGAHVNTSFERIALEVIVDDKRCQDACERVLIDRKPGEYLRLYIRDEILSRLKERRSYEDHKGYCHVSLKGLDDLPISELSIYYAIGGETEI
ncbi:hypothetical protein HOD38_00710 [archaeon]|jgi:hypothetical protein|nr:hypothetical protein [archaeon]MBT4396766.1 hypothetical protein [archaeon]MBT4441376.1 hypothetical protein [archaeon]